MVVGLAFAVEGPTLLRVTAAAAAAATAAAWSVSERFTLGVVRSLPPLSHCVCVSVFPLDLPSRGSEERTALIEQRVDTTRKVRFYTSPRPLATGYPVRVRAHAVGQGEWLPFPFSVHVESALSNPFECRPRQGAAAQGIAAAPPASARPGGGCAHKPSCRLTPNLGLSPAAVGLVSTW